MHRVEPLGLPLGQMELPHRANRESRRLDALKKAAAQEPKAGKNGRISPANTMPFIVDAVKAYATVGEICEALREVYGTYTETAFA